MRDLFVQIEQAQPFPERLRAMLDEVEQMSDLDPAEREHAVGRIERYLEDHARAR